MKNDYLNGKISKEDLSKYKIRVDTIDAVINDNYNFSNSFKSTDFRLQYIPGDDTYYYRPFIYDEVKQIQLQESGWVDTRNEGKFYYFSQTPVYKLADLNAYELANENFKIKMYKASKMHFEEIQIKYFQNLTENDLEIINQKILICDIEILKNERSSKARDIYASIDKALNNGLENKALERIDTILIYYQDIFNANEVAEIQRKQNAIQRKQAGRLKTENDEVRTIANNKKLIIELDEKLISLYYATGDYYSGYVASKKSRLFSHYNDIYRNYNNDIISNVNDHQTTLEKTSLLIAVQNKMIQLIDADSKEIEKLLKKAVTIEEKINILR